MEALSPEVVDVDDEDVRTIGRKGTGAGACGGSRTRAPADLDAGAEAGDRGGEPGFGADADRGRAQIRDQQWSAVFMAPAGPGRPGQRRHRTGAEFCAGRAGARAAGTGRQ